MAINGGGVPAEDEREEHWQALLEAANGQPVTDVMGTLNGEASTPRARSRSLNMKLGRKMLVPEVGTASDVALARDDLYMESVSLRRGFASEFVAMLEDDARKLFRFDDDDFGDEEEDENTALKPRSKRERAASGTSQAAMTRVILTFLKSMVGSYLLYTPKMFRNGGLAAGVGTLLIAAWVSCDNMMVLIHLAEKTGKRSYAQLGYVAFGKWGQLMVDVSLVLSQLSFCCGYFMFLVLNIPSAMPVPVPGSPVGILLTPNAIIAFQVLVYIPMAWIRHLKYLALAMFGANVCMWVGLAVISTFSIGSLIENGAEPVLMYNPDSFVLFMGAVVVCFEGIGLVLPLRDSMEPHLQHKFPGVVRSAMFALAIIFSLFGASGYLAYGERIETFVTMNIPRGTAVGAVSVGLYCVAIMMSYPLQLFPAVHTLEGHLFHGAKKNLTTKWLKNVFRTMIVLLTAIIGKYAGPSFDNFAGLIGGFCAVPLALVYPSAFYLRIMGDSMSTPKRIWTWIVLLSGSFAGVLCTWRSLATWA